MNSDYTGSMKPESGKVQWPLKLLIFLRGDDEKLGKQFGEQRTNMVGWSFVRVLISVCVNLMSHA